MGASTFKGLILSTLLVAALSTPCGSAVDDQSFPAFKYALGKIMARHKGVVDPREVEQLAWAFWMGGHGDPNKAINLGSLAAIESGFEVWKWASPARRLASNVRPLARVDYMGAHYPTLMIVLWKMGWIKGPKPKWKAFHASEEWNEVIKPFYLDNPHLATLALCHHFNSLSTKYGGDENTIRVWKRGDAGLTPKWKEDTDVHVKNWNIFRARFYLLMDEWKRDSALRGGVTINEKGRKP